MSASLSVKRVIVGEGGERHEREVHEREGRERGRKMKRKRWKEDEGGRKRERERGDSGWNVSWKIDWAFKCTETEMTSTFGGKVSRE